MLRRTILGLSCFLLVLSSGCAQQSTKTRFARAHYDLPRVHPVPILPLASTERFGVAGGGAFAMGSRPEGVRRPGDSSGRLTLSQHMLAAGIYGMLNIKSTWAAFYLSEQVDKTDGVLSMTDDHWAILLGWTMPSRSNRVLFYTGIGMTSYGRDIQMGTTDSSGAFLTVHDSANDYPLILGLTAMKGKGRFKPYGGLSFRKSLDLPGFWKDGSEKRNVIDLSQFQLDLGARIDVMRGVSLLGGTSWALYTDERIQGSDWRFNLGGQYAMGSK
ncbi:MAG: hypothetical protein IPK50_15845 [Fibrobacterota bacterium]|nr:MAG: hypothetical protein IPK50_15845 [Fibrobacterota bacterium]